MNTDNSALDFQDVLKRSALHYLERHQAEHLTGDDKLFSRTVTYLQNDYEISGPSAEKAVHLAMSDMGLCCTTTRPA
ncbi:hypothetical protein HUT29_07050 [Pseudomonas chlororaphis]|uniref:hypothetical protein n=1 Tax=Pseudomonas chlororaphis TaxID=587753 RepID=UPI001B3036C7|nr:hypothetical protein [Pseudomonas chlororaphis]QTT81053.1 hypothetical protein HUT29_07050 [Pseudomonas chlororaphis]